MCEINIDMLKIILITKFILYILHLIYFKFNFVKLFLFIFNMKYTKWGLGIGDWGLGIGAQSPIPNPQSPKYYL